MTSKLTVIREFSMCGRCMSVAELVCEISVLTVNRDSRQRVELCQVCLMELAQRIEDAKETQQ